MYNILICDDEVDIVNALNIYLTSEGYTTFKTYNGKQALEVLKENEIHLILLDIMMPIMDGITTLSSIREQYNTPVILLSAKSEDTDKILGLNIGADDYVTKPFNPVVLQARVKSQLRRYMTLGGKTKEEHQLALGNITVDKNSKSVYLDGEDVALTKIEYEILILLMENPNTVFSPKQIYAKVWEDTAYGAENTVAVHIRHLREKIEIDPAQPRYLKVVWGHGYKMEAINEKNQ